MGPLGIWKQMYIRYCPANISDWWLMYVLRNYPEMKVSGSWYKRSAWAQLMVWCRQVTSSMSPWASLVASESNQECCMLRAYLFLYCRSEIKLLLLLLLLTDVIIWPRETSTVRITALIMVQHRYSMRTMHGFGAELIRNPAIWLVESRGSYFYIMVE